MLRQWRDRVAPATIGVPTSSRRRATGLRREELAGFAGISVDYLTRLEQGRATSPSNQVLEALARALRLSDDDRDLLYRLAGRAAPGPDVVPSRIPASVQRMLDRLAHTPVAVYDAAGNLLVANSPYDALMGATSELRGPDRNFVWRNFVGSGSRAVLTDDEHAALQAQMVADLRLTAARYPADRSVQRLVGELVARSPRFAELWNAGVADGRRNPSRHKIIEHPEIGRLTLDCDVLVVAGDDLRIMVYTAEPGTEDAERLALVIVLGTQSLAG